MMDKIFGQAAKAMALAGGFILLALVAITCVSITGRAFVFAGLEPIRGDYDLVEMGIAAAIFAFLPWCQYSRGHASVGLFTSVFPAGVNRFLDFVFDLLMSLAAFVIAWRLYAGMMSKRSYGETTFILGAPLWMAYAACLAGACLFVLVSAYCVFRSAAALSGRQPAVPLEGAPAGSPEGQSDHQKESPG